MRDLSKVIDDEIKYDMAHKLNGVTIELLYQVDNHGDYLKDNDCKKIIRFVNSLQEVIDRLKEEL